MSLEAKVIPSVKASDILKKLDEGKTRKEIAAELGVPKAALDRLFKNQPVLKGKRPTRTGVSFEDDITASPVKTPLIEEPKADNAVGDLATSDTPYMHKVL